MGHASLSVDLCLTCGVMLDTDPLEGVKIEPPEADENFGFLHCGVEDAVPPGFEDAVLRSLLCCETD